MKTMKMRSKALMGLGVMLLVCVTVAFAAVNVKGLIVDALTGYTVAGAAANNQMLCGNGTVATFQATCGSIHTPTTNIVTGSRTLGTVYQNTTGYTMTVAVSASWGSTGTLYADVATSSACVAASTCKVIEFPAAFPNGAVTFTVPNGSYYGAQVDVGGSVALWTEWY